MGNQNYGFKNRRDKDYSNVTLQAPSMDWLKGCWGNKACIERKRIAAETGLVYAQAERDRAAAETALYQSLASGGKDSDGGGMSAGVIIGLILGVAALGTGIYFLATAKS